jgi:putative endonuclease
VISGQATRLALQALDGLARRLGMQPAQGPAHLKTGRRGEEEAYFYLRRLGYVIVARNYRTPRLRGELDLVAWDQGVLCFVEVKTRSSRAVKPAEAAVDRDKREELQQVARDYWRRISRSGKKPPACRFDILSIYQEKEGAATEMTLFQNAFSWS